MIRPTLEYCAGVWGCCGEVNSGILQTLRKCVGRIVIETPSSDTATKALKWSSLRSRRDEHILKLVRKCIHCRCPQYFKNYFVFNKDICARSTHQSNLLHQCLPEQQKWPRDPFITMEVCTCLIGEMVKKASKCLYFLIGNKSAIMSRRPNCLGFTQAV